MLHSAAKGHGRERDFRGGPTGFCRRLQSAPLISNSDPDSSASKCVTTGGAPPGDPFRQFCRLPKNGEEALFAIGVEQHWQPQLIGPIALLLHRQIVVRGGRRRHGAVAGRTADEADGGKGQDGHAGAGPTARNGRNGARGRRGGLRILQVAGLRHYVGDGEEGK